MDPTFIFGRWEDVEVKNTIYHKMLLDSVVPLPISNNLCFDVVPHLSIRTLKRGGKVGRKQEIEWNIVDTLKLHLVYVKNLTFFKSSYCRQFRSSVYNHFIFNVCFMIAVVFCDGFLSRTSITIWNSLGSKEKEKVLVNKLLFFILTFVLSNVHLHLQTIQL